MNSLKMVVTNVSNYGFINLSIMILYELLYSLKKKYREQIFYDESITNKYYEIKNKSGIRKESKLLYNAPYSPTPIFFLKLILSNLNLNSKSLKNYFFIDFGCGAGRTLTFFHKVFQKKLGIDFNKKYRKFLPTGTFLNMDLRKINNIKKIFKKTNSSKYVLYFYEPFDEKLIKKIIKVFIRKKIFVVIVNVKNIKVKNLRFIYNKKFNNTAKNIKIYSNHYRI